MNESEFKVLYEKTLDKIINDIEEQDSDSDLDIDFNNEVLTLTTDNGVFIINKQTAVKEIWLSSPISGPYHFIYSSNRWKTRKGDELISILQGELQIQFTE